jgi:hypothetical protein
MISAVRQFHNYLPNLIPTSNQLKCNTQHTMMWYRNASNIGCKWKNYDAATLPTQERVNPYPAIVENMVSS